MNSLIIKLQDRLNRLFPGLIVVGTIAAAAGFLSLHYKAPVMLFALLIGIAFNFLSTDERCAPGIEFSSKKILRFGVALLGFRVTLDQILGLGTSVLLLVPILVLSSIAVSWFIAKLMGRRYLFGLLTACAVSICGAAAALAVASVLPNWKERHRDTLFVVVCVTGLSTFAMIAYPILFSVGGFSDVEIGILIGATIHDVAQVVGAGYAVSNETGDVATFIKLLRISMLPFIVIIIALLLKGDDELGTISPKAFPWFALGFALCLIVNSIGFIPEMITRFLADVSQWFLVFAIAGLGVSTSLKSMMELGGKSIALMVLQTVALLGIAILAVSTDFI
ncbi:MAG: putative sulfate exporter family transporter [Candidatus Thioglobus sp.]|nr:putative sulfate exporter family transporter [Candidatus Pseudothioglobus aerophilus]MBT4974985.1 putative sulfate exporter family transporter [Gammaproteobacteria bacterium]MBT5407834.1 putative sulfate exporter family transporter [Gammaproteobacteria bacterium]